jgi:shikimate kinase
MATSPLSADGGDVDPASRHLVLVGMMATGKTTIGRAVAKRVKRPFIDSDIQIETTTGRTVREIFEQDGEAAFRQLEADALASALATTTPAVIAAAGGVVLSPHNRALLKRAGRVVWLRADPRTLASRVRPNDHRPLLEHDPLGVLRRLADERQDLYAEVADTVIDVDRRDKRDLVREVEALVP